MPKRPKRRHETSHNVSKENLSDWKTTCKRVSDDDIKLARRAGYGPGVYQAIRNAGKALGKDPSKFNLYISTLKSFQKADEDQGVITYHLEMARKCIKRGLSFGLLQKKKTQRRFHDEPRRGGYRGYDYPRGM